MSGLLAGKVWISNLDPDLKPLAATLADLGHDDGTAIYPTVAYICWRLGRTENTVRDGLRDLRAMGVLEVVRPGGGKFPTIYQLNEERLPKRAPWKEVRKGLDAAAFMAEEPAGPLPINRETTQRLGTPPTQQLGTPPTQLTGKQRSVSFNEPLKEPLKEPSVETGWVVFTNTFYRYLAVKPQKNKGAVQKFQSAFRRLGATEFETRMHAWLAATAEEYKRQGTQSYAVNNFLDEVDDFEPSVEVKKQKSYPRLVPHEKRTAADKD